MRFKEEQRRAGNEFLSVVFRELLNLISPGSGVPTEERRETIRLMCSIGATVKTKKTTREARVINASLTGLSVELESKIRKNTPVSVHREQHGGPVCGRVVWCRSVRGANRYQVGITYDDDKSMLRVSWLKPALKELGFTVGRINEKRLLTRVPGHNRRCFLKSMAGETYSSGELLNLSIGGALVDSEVEIPKGHKLKLKTDPIANIPELICVAEVKSCRRNARTRKFVCGLRFLEAEEKLVRRHMSAMMGDC